MCYPWQVGCLVKGAANSAVQSFVNALADGVLKQTEYVSTFWMKLPSPTVAHGGGQSWSEVATLAQMHGDLAIYTGFFAVLSFTFALAKIGFTQQAAGAQNIIRQVAAVGAGTLVVTAVTQMLIVSGDAFSTWILARASGGSPSEGMKKLIETGIGHPNNALGMWIILFLIELLASLMQCIYMLVRGAALIVLLSIVPPTAAGAGTDDGWARFKRICMLILGFALYKPVAAIIYAAGIRLMSQYTDGPTGKDGNVQNAMFGLAVMVMAGIALPAFIKFISPAAAAGSSSAFSGGAAVGAIAAGAALVTLGGAGGAGAASAGSSSAGGAAKVGAATPPPGPPPGPGPASTGTSAVGAGNPSTGASAPTAPSGSEGAAPSAASDTGSEGSAPVGGSETGGSSGSSEDTQPISSGGGAGETGANSQETQAIPTSGQGQSSSPGASTGARPAGAPGSDAAAGGGAQLASGSRSAPGSSPRADSLVKGASQSVQSAVSAAGSDPDEPEAPSGANRS